MSDLQEAANQFIENLVTQNVAGLMSTFTPEAMQKAMSMGQGPQPQGPPPAGNQPLPPANPNAPVPLDPNALWLFRFGHDGQRCT